MKEKALKPKKQIVKKNKGNKVYKPIPNKHEFTPEELKDNNYAMKFKTPKERKKLCDLYYKHLSSGYSKESFVPCNMKTMNRYMKDFPEDFPAEKIEEAERNNFLFWESLGIDGTKGKQVTIKKATKDGEITTVESFNPTSWIFNMKNRFGWRDRKETEMTIHNGDLTEDQKIKLLRIKQMEQS